MNCQACGNENSKDARFCGTCGASLTSGETSIGTELPMVSFGEAISRGFRNYFNFSGRATRAENWWFVLFTLLVGIILTAADMVIGTYNSIVTVGLLSGLFRLAVLIPSLALGARRLHDINRSGWWLLGLLGYFCLLPGLVMTVIIIIWAIKQGDRGPNKYGPDPRQAPLQQS